MVHRKVLGVGGVLALLAVAAVMALALGRSGSPATANAEPDGYMYSAKFLCGTISGGEGPLSDGEYATAINVHNLQDTDVHIYKKAVLAPVEPAVGEPSPYLELDVPPGAAFEIDCPDIIDTILGGPGLAFAKGFVVVQSAEELDVWGVYTSAHTLSAPTAGTGIGEDIEVVPAKRQPLPALGNFDTDGAPYDIGAGIGNGPHVAGPGGPDDGTVPNADALADSSDPDDDNDGLADGVDADPRGDITYDDDGDGNPACLNGDGSGVCGDVGGEVACLQGSDDDGSDDGPSWDVNCNGIRDGVIPVGPGLDTDGDGLPDDYEVNKWGTCPDGVSVVGLLNCATVLDPQDTDGDGMGDCKEVYDNDGNGAVLFPTDGLNGVKASLLAWPAFGKDGDFDVDGNNAILFPTDGLNAVKAALVAGFCTPP